MQIMTIIECLNYHGILKSVAIPLALRTFMNKIEILYEMFLNPDYQFKEVSEIMPT